MNRRGLSPRMSILKGTWDRRAIKYTKTSARAYPHRRMHQEDTHDKGDGEQNLHPRVQPVHDAVGGIVLPHGDVT